MVKDSPFKFRTDTDLAEGLLELVKQLDATLELRQPLKMYLAGGMAAHLYTGARVTSDVDAEFSRRFIVPSDVLVETKQGQMLYLDTNYNSTFGLMHENYLQDAIKVPLGTDMIQVYVLSPVDLIVSKIARFADQDREDIESIIRVQRVTADEIDVRAREALQGYVGNPSGVLYNIGVAVKMAQDIAAMSSNNLRQAPPDSAPSPA